MISLLIFDLDGTLVDSKQDIADALNFALVSEGFSSLEPSAIHDMVGRGARHLVQDALGNPSNDVLARVFLAFWNRYEAHLLDRTQLYPGVREFLENSHHPHKAVVTNKPIGFTHKILQGLKIDHFFRWVIGGDSLGVQKPDPSVLDSIFSDLGERPEGLMVGDSDVDIDCGRGAGLLTCAVTYGFRSREELEVSQPDYMIDNFEQLSQIPILQMREKKTASS